MTFDVFDLDERLLEDYETFARSFTKIRSPELRKKVEGLYRDRRFWPEPLIQINPHYERHGTVAALVASDGGRSIHPRMAEIFRDERSPDGSFSLYRHQEEAIVLALRRESFVVTTGTGSGKSLCFFLPIIDAALKARESRAEKRTRAIVIYPMNALANSQEKELAKFLGEAEAERPVTFARYTGAVGEAERKRISDNPPDILLTNFMMLELLMTRQDDVDRKVIENCEGLQFLVLDELHTYRGRQGADVAMLVRRLRQRLGDPDRPPLCIGTSATMATEGTKEDRKAKVAEVARNLFGTEIGRDGVITESLARATDPNRSANTGLRELKKAVSLAAQGEIYRGMSNDVLAQDPLAIWVETRLGVTLGDGKLERAKPLTMQEAVVILAADSGENPAACEAGLKNALLAFSQSEKDRAVMGGSEYPLFAFKLHQFISGAGRLYTTLDAEDERSVTFDGQIFDPGSETGGTLRRLFSTHFCRSCGQEFHPATLISRAGEERFEKREIDDVPLDDEELPEGESMRWGFLLPDRPDLKFEGKDEDYPDAWLEEAKNGTLRLKSNYRRNRAEAKSVGADGTCGVGLRRVWFMPGKFRFCPNCGEVHSDSSRDMNRLASLSAEGRSSATTMLVTSILRWMNEDERNIEQYHRKLLAFTDNRQDAALQSGYFNDFIFVTLLRGAILAALHKADADGLAEDDVGSALQDALGFRVANQDRRSDWLWNADPKGAAAVNAEKAIREVLAHRFWVDQRRGWRFTNPNLEQLGLIEVDYLGLDDMIGDDAVFDQNPTLTNANKELREKAVRALLDHLRQGLAVECDALDSERVERLPARARDYIKPPWGLEEEYPLGQTTFLLRVPSRKELKRADEALILRGGPRSLLGRKMRKLFGASLKDDDVEEIIQVLVAAATEYQIVLPASHSMGQEPGWRLAGSAVIFKRGSKQQADRPNSFFRQLYQTIAGLLADGGQALFGLEGRAHTAQVDSDLRELREARFRHGDEDQAYLEEQAQTLQDYREDKRFLPALFCSPTMELGVDISAMNVVYLRNLPPTPANYAQRSGRAGRSGQAALVVTYAAAQSPHDQYYFEKPSDMVVGVVRPPAIDLSNRELVESHLQAEWLAASGVALTSAIIANLDRSDPALPLLPEKREQAFSDATRQAATTRIEALLKALQEDYGAEVPDWFEDPRELAVIFASQAPDAFEAAFQRWRDLLATAKRESDIATETLKDLSISPQDRKAAAERQNHANKQIGLLLQGSASQASEYYSYRYLATEGFLPGYNFPRLPLTAFIPGTRLQGNQRYLQRPRFLAISEFGPHSLIYHEGRAYRADRALLRESGLTTFSLVLCGACGAYHQGDPPEHCHVCGASLADGHPIDRLHRIENVGTKPVERITANDEERRRQGFDLQTTFTFDRHDGRISRRFEDGDGHFLTASFAPAALIRRINKGLRRRKHESELGYWIEAKSGRWKGAPDEAKEASPTDVVERIVPVVEDRKNALLLRFPPAFRKAAGSNADTLMASLQHALARGIEAICQLEEGEILGEPTPSRKDRKALFFFEAAEGGAGALSRLMNEERGFQSVAHEALRIMHFTEESIVASVTEGPGALQEEEHARCVEGCYRCLLSYFNQPDHELIRRKDPRLLDFLVRLAAARSELSGQEPANDGLPTPDEAIRLNGVLLTLVWRRARLCAIEEAQHDPDLEAAAEDRGLELIVLPSEPQARAQAEAALRVRLEESL